MFLDRKTSRDQDQDRSGHNGDHQKKGRKSDFKTKTSCKDYIFAQ